MKMLGELGHDDIPLPKRNELMPKRADKHRVKIRFSFHVLRPRNWLLSAASTKWSLLMGELKL